MTRNHKTLDIFIESNQLLDEVYAWADRLPAEEKFGLQSQLRRAALSVPTNLVEGCNRRTDSDTAHFVFIALASAAEVQYLLDFAKKRYFTAEARAIEQLIAAYASIVRRAQAYGQWLERQALRGRPRP